MTVSTIEITPDHYYTVHSAARLLGVSRDVLTADATAGRLVTRKVGDRTLIKGRWLIRWIETGMTE